MLHIVIAIFLLVLLIIICFVTRKNIIVKHNKKIYIFQLNYELFEFYATKLLIKSKKIYRFLKREITYLKKIIPVFIVTVIVVAIVISVGLLMGKYTTVLNGIWENKSLFITPILIVFFVDSINNEMKRKEILHNQYNLTTIIELHTTNQYTNKIEGIFGLNYLTKIKNPLNGYQELNEYINILKKELYKNIKKIKEYKTLEEIKNTFTRKTKAYIKYIKNRSIETPLYNIEYKRKIETNIILDIIEQRIDEIEDLKTDDDSVIEEILNCYRDVLRDILHFYKEISYTWVQDKNLEIKVENILEHKITSC